MKPAPFQWHAVRSTEEALAVLAEHGDEAAVLAGGQSLVPTMNFRLARPEHLVDINGAAELDYLEADEDRVRIGALTRHAAFHRPVTDDVLGALLAEVVRHVAHLPIRVRGTFAGSLAHGDPAAEWATVATALEAVIVARSRSAERDIPAAEFFDGVLSNTLQPEEMICEVRLPRLGDDWRWGFSEYSRRAGDFALGMTLAALRLENGRIAEVRVAVGAIADRPVRVPAAEEALAGQHADAGLADAAAEAAREGIEPLEDLHASVEYRRDLVRATTRRAVLQALS